MIDKVCSIEDIVGSIESGMTLGIGGWGGRRKPMAVIRELLNTDVNDLTVISYGGPDVGMLASAGKIGKLVFGFVSMDLVPLEAANDGFPWTDEALSRLENIPQFARPMAKTGIEKFAKDQGLGQIDARVLEQAREFFGM